MKIYNIENGKEKIYVQTYDLAMLIRGHKIEMPANIFNKVFGKVFVVAENKFDFLEFSEPDDIKFFLDTDWIINYKEFKNFTEEELKNTIESIKDEMKEIAYQYNMEVKEDKLLELMSKYKYLEYKVIQLEGIIYLKRGEITFPFPIAPDNDGFKLTSDNNNSPYIVQQGLNPLQMLLYRLDGKNLDLKNDIIPQGFIQSANSILIQDNLDKNEFFGDFESSNELSEDKKYFITTYRIVAPKKDEDINDKTNSLQNKSSDKEKLTLRMRLKNSIEKILKK